jgi:hypothetical protein
MKESRPPALITILHIGFDTYLEVLATLTFVVQAEGFQLLFES